jgi:hypothetical protein
MKVEVNEVKDSKEIEFPCLMKYNDNNLVLLVTGKSENKFIGTAINGNGAHVKGEHGNQWQVYELELFNGTITLSND